MQTLLRTTCRAARRWCRDVEHGITSQRDLAEARNSMLDSPRCQPGDSDLLRQLALKVHPRDGMYRYGAHHYLSSGLSGLRCIRRSLAVAGIEPGPDFAILDFPCGFGRVLRFLNVAYPDAQITAAELDPEAVAFCETQFSALPMHSIEEVDSLEFGRRFDLIWCGSLLTHVDEAAAVGILRFFRRHLRDGGLCVFTTHGDLIARWLRVGRVDYGLPDHAIAAMLETFDDGAYAYANYPGMESYGISLVDPARMRQLAREAGDWESRLFLEHGWDDCQDVHSFQAVA